MLKEFKDFLKIQNFLLENYKFDVNKDEEILNEFCNNLLDVLQKYNLFIPDKKNTNFVPSTDKENEFIIKIKFPQSQNIDINNLLKNLFYDEIKQHLIKKIYKDLLNNLNSNIIEKPKYSRKKQINKIWKTGTWKDGKWYDGIWINGVWKNGIWENGVWKNGIWGNGIWKNGVWETGQWLNGKWYNGEWKSGVWEKGEIYSKKFNQFIISNVSPDKFYEFEKNYKSLTDFIKNIN